MTFPSNNTTPTEKKILILGAGRSSTYLIEYLAKQAPEQGWKLTVGDTDLEQAQRKTEMYPHVEAILFNIFDQKQREKQISQTDIVISMLPAVYHIHVARTCIRFGKHLLTASYISPEIKELHKEALKENVLILMEMGLDPGIDHMSAMQVINHLTENGANITSFKSYCGGLVSSESDNNPWGYKFTWNPRNVVIAGQSTVKYMEDGDYKYIPPHQIFARAEQVSVDEFGVLEAYGNRDSLSYREVYGLQNADTIVRGTLRKNGFCKAWQLLVKLGVTDDSYTLENSENMTYHDFVSTFLSNESEESKSIEQRVAEYMGVSESGEEMEKLKWLGIFGDEKIDLANATPAQILQQLLERRWMLAPNDKDMVVMQHQFNYELNGEKKNLVSSLIIKGEDSIHTAMAKAVGLPLAVAAKLIIQGKIDAKGVQIPVWREIYEPVMEELEHLGIQFKEHTETSAGKVSV
ncbi:saccharopine dehydrogenase [Rhodocytophaga rosea]|uniref:Saccharopine dehydrogenase n=1 Tax=Rhodocytophaga rosea TaxID=2704465 RepID=A0A6C0GMV4_9BACT|nr:saccharopine dehydrogenase C-terminal domain-containing protein [Rhodocytophaga rosea]QHT69366.1 saccharopine dehydrogenase [Rhodocytophaga rosea]